MISRAMILARARWPQGCPWPWILFFTALSARLIYILQGHEVPPQDTPDYDEIALNLLRGEGFVARQNWFGHEMRSWRTPFYPFFLASIYQLAGYSHFVVKVAQALVGAGSVVLVYELAGKLRPHIAPTAGLCAAFYGPLVASSNEVMSEVWFTFWILLAAWQLVGAMEGGRGTKVNCLAGGAAIGMAALTRPVGLIFFPGVCPDSSPAVPPKGTVPKFLGGACARACGDSLDMAQLSGSRGVGSHFHSRGIHRCQKQRVGPRLAARPGLEHRKDIF